MRPSPYDLRIHKALTIGGPCSLISTFAAFIFPTLFGWLVVAGEMPLFIVGCTLIATSRRYKERPTGLARGLVWSLMAVSLTGLLLTLDVCAASQPVMIAMSLCAFVAWLAANLYCVHFFMKADRVSAGNTSGERVR